VEAANASFALGNSTVGVTAALQIAFSKADTTTRAKARAFLSQGTKVPKALAEDLARLAGEPPKGGQKRKAEAEPEA